MLGVVAASLSFALLAGCALVSAPAPSLSPDTTGVASDLLPFYGQTLAWEACETDGFDCTTVRAPRDWADPDAGEIELAVIRHRAPGEALGSLLLNPGGPGVSGYDFVRDGLSSTIGDPLEENYDVVGFDPRGVARSAPITCLDAAGMDEYLYGVPDAPRDSDEWTDASIEADATFAEACEENSGGLLPFISTEEAARDLDLLRAVLGDPALNYLGRSWGTALGTAYARLYPERVGRMVLDGAMDPTVSGSETGAMQAIGFESSLRAFAADCASQSECPYRGDVDDVLADVGALLARVDRRPLASADGRELGADSLLTAIIATLYSQSSWPFLRTLLADVEDGDATNAFVAADSYNRRVGGEYVFNTTEAFTAYNCRDYPPDSAEEQAAARALVEREAPTTADYWFGSDVCAVWPAASTAVREPVHADGAAPILVIGTTNDPATPYAWAESLAEQLSSGILVTRVGEGHTGYTQGNDCVDAAVEAYFVDGVAPDSDIRCE